MITHQEAKQRAARITSRLRALGYDLSTNHGLQALAAAENYPDWNRMLAAIEKRQPESKSDVRTSRGVERPHLDRAGRGGRTSLVCCGPGGGSTTILSLRMAAEHVRGGRCIFVSLVTDAASALEDTFLSRGHHRILIEGWRTPGGDLDHQVTWSGDPKFDNPQSSLLVTLRIRDKEVLFDGERRDLFALLAKLPELLGSAGGRGNLDTISLVLLDEAHRVCFGGARDLVRDVITRFASGGAEVVASTQLFDGVTVHPGEQLALDRVIATRSMRDRFQERHPAHPLLSRIVVLENLADRLPDMDQDESMLEAFAGVVYRGMHGEQVQLSESQRGKAVQGLLDELTQRWERAKWRKEVAATLAAAEPTPPPALVGFRATV
ncbi:hypothetical protein [Ralstonia sp. ASV6]|uniref:hypothetical protein n=1 Tax=Ralstonia sp. ASV6 TaxID=2795124 RepID=UPI0018EBFD56|nr:hypothetical protein [Ralstonia sp. ASV6]